MRDDPFNRMKVRRGSQLPQAVLDEETVQKIYKCVAIRKEMDERRKQYTNENIAKLLGVHVRTVEKAIQGYTWTRLDGWEQSA